MSGAADSDCTGSWDETEKIIESSKFYPCLTEYLDSRQGQSDASNIVMEDDKIRAFRQTVNSIYIDSAANEGVDLLLEIRAITDKYGLDETYSYGQRYLDYEGYVTFGKDTSINVVLALVAVLVVLMIVTANLKVTLFVLFCVALVDLFLFALLAFWGVALNSVTVVNIVIAIGLAVDYTAHIGHSFLTVDPPEKNENGDQLSDHEKRIFKARGALGSMGASVFHGSASTFLAIVVLAPSKSYIFQSFFKMWFGIIIFGVCNGFILLPAILSIWGPLNTVHNLHLVQDEECHTKVKDKASAQIEIGMIKDENAA